MANELRRNALAVIANEPTGMDVSRLVEEVADRIEAAKTEAASDEVVQEVRQSLHHIHMPKMVSAGLVEYDDESRTVKATSEIRTLEGRRRFGSKPCTSSLISLAVLNRNPRVVPRSRRSPGYGG